MTIENIKDRGREPPPATIESVAQQLAQHIEVEGAAIRKLGEEIEIVKGSTQNNHTNIEVLRSKSNILLGMASALLIMACGVIWRMI